MVHRSIIGSFERFIGILLEHYQGAFPLWLSPIQIVLLPISNRHAEKAKEVLNLLTEEKIRAEIDDRSETLQLKIRDAALQKVPYMGIIGDKEIEESKKENVISVRTRDGKDLGRLEVSKLLQKLQEEIDKKI